MNDDDNTNRFREGIQRRLEKAKTALQSKRHEVEQTMSELDESEQQFNRRANQLCRHVIRPKLEEFVSHFENARIDVAGPEPRVHCQFRPCVRFPAQASIEFGVRHSETIQDAFSIRYHAEFLPIFIKFDPDDEYRTPVDAPHTEALGEWVEQKLLGFLDSYVQIETNEQYQRLGVQIDPVCGMPVAKAVGLTSSYGGKQYYLCTQRCFDRFVAQPEAFVNTTA